MSDLEFLLNQRNGLKQLLNRVEGHIKQHVTTWQGLAQCGMIVDAIQKYRDDEFTRTGVRPGLVESKTHIDAFIASQSK